jgi:hypothetical protein
MIMTARTAYRATFKDYGRKLDALQDLMASSPADRGQIEVALLEAEKARVAHSCARDLLAKELAGAALPPLPSGAEQHIRGTAQLLWELAGRPEGTAERDWREAELLVQNAAPAGC